MRYAIRSTKSAEKELGRLRAFDRQRISDAIESQLGTTPELETRNRKQLGDRVTADFEYVPPLWELRVGEFRVFYTVEEREVVILCAVRRKPPHLTTHEVLHEND